MKNKLLLYCQLMRLNKPIGILLLLWPTLWGLWLAAGGAPPLKIMVIFVLGVVVMRSAGCVINDIIDRNLDGAVVRTQNRPLARGQLSVFEALLLFCGLCFLALILVLFLNHYTVLLAMIGLVLALIYPFTKRFLSLPQAVLGLTFAWGIPMAFSAIQNQVPAYAWLLYAANVVWVVAYDTEYAMVDRDDDLRIGIKSSAILFGRCDRLMIAILQMLALALLFLVGLIRGLGAGYYIGLVVALGLMGYQQRLIANRQPARCFKAFLNNHWVGVVLFLGLMLNDVF